MYLVRLSFALVALAAVGALAETGWQVCTLEGLMSLSDSAACEILPPFTLLENAMRATAHMLRKLDEFADDHERDLQYSFINRRISIVPPPFLSAGAGADFSPDRRIEGYISSDLFASQTINRSEACYCNPHWLQYQEANYADPQQGIPCEIFCDASKYLAIAEHIPDVADEFDAESGNLFRGTTMATFYATSSYVIPWDWWISQGIALALIVPMPNVVWPGVFAAGPDVNPSRESQWMEPMYNMIEWQVFLQTPLFDASDKYLGVVGGEITLLKAGLLLESIEPTPGGFAMLLSRAGCVLLTPARGYLKMFGSDYNYTLSHNNCLSAATAGNFSELISIAGDGDGDETGYVLIDIENAADERWALAYHRVPGPGWLLVMATPLGNVVSGDDFSVSPSAISTTAASNSSAYEFALALNNSGAIPMIVMLQDDGGDSAGGLLFLNASLVNSTGAIHIGGGEEVRLLFRYEGEYPFHGTVTFVARDAVTEYHLCYESRRTVSVSIGAPDSAVEDNAHSSRAGTYAAIAVSATAFLLFVVGGAIFFLAMRHMRHKVKVLSQPLSSSELLGTAGAAAIKKLGRIRDKRGGLSVDDRLSLTKIIQLIASDELHRADYYAKKKTGMSQQIDPEIDAYLMDNLVGRRQDSNFRLLDIVNSEVPAGTVGRTGATIDSKTAATTNSRTGRVRFVPNVAAWEFDPRATIVAGEDVVCEPLTEVAVAAFEQRELFKAFSISKSKFIEWVREVEAGYVADNPYHNAAHAADVLQALHVMLLNLAGRGPGLLNNLATLALFIAAIVHDYKHPGVNNTYLQNTMDPLWLDSNGVSILENMHIREAFRDLMARGPEAWTSECFANREEFVEFHRVTTDAVLATDMARHVEIKSQFETRLASVRDVAELYSQKTDVSLVCRMLIKLADISNAAREWRTAECWAGLVMEEFWRQGEKEERAGLPKSPFMDRATTSMPKCQATFYQFVAAPLFESASALFSKKFSDAIKSNLRVNEDRWRELYSEQQQQCGSAMQSARNKF